MRAPLPPPDLLPQEQTETALLSLAEALERAKQEADSLQSQEPGSPPVHSPAPSLAQPTGAAPPAGRVAPTPLRPSALYSPGASSGALRVTGGLADFPLSSTQHGH